MPRISKELQEIKKVLSNVDVNFEVANTPKRTLKKLIIHLMDIEDVRCPGMVEYPLSEIILLTFIATLAFCDTWKDITRFCNANIKFFKKFLKLKNGIPSHDTFQRVFGLIDPINFNKVVIDFFLDRLDALKKVLKIKPKKDETEYTHIAVDGKELKGSGRLYKGSETIRNAQILNVYNNSKEVCIYSKAIDNKTNEIPVARELLKEMNLNKTIVTFDALHTQKETIKIITSKNGDYVGGLKANHEGLYNDVSLFFTEEVKTNIENSKDYYETIEKSHSQIETRKYYLTTNVHWYHEINEWSKLTSFILYEKKVNKDGKETTEIRYYITSLNDIKLCAESIRGHWSVENNLHWQLDYAFREDEQTTIDKVALSNLSVLKKLSLALINLNRDLFKGDSIRTIRKCVGWATEDSLNKLLLRVDEKFIKSLIKE